MIVAVLVGLGLVALLVAALRLERDVADAQERFRVLMGGYADAGLLAESRQRFRRRQQHMEQAVDTGTAGVAGVHRTLAGLLGRSERTGSGFYSGVRALNRGLGRTVSGLFAPRPKKHSDSLADWRAADDRRDRDAD
ncbi:hypothetical protein [Salinisphaera orenii]|uniref:hypothetical protein n=1 Tax=Salinisphaera orenii TaxID=856731 RepID=UPI000F48403C|nr:hypothetical protein [Salinisphaera halophila]